MQSITNEFVLVRMNIQTNEEVVILQSDDKKELDQLKYMLESQIPIEVYPYQYHIKAKIALLINPN